jgi:hypothetical protein
MIATHQKDNKAEKIGRQILREQNNMTNRDPKIPYKDKWQQLVKFTTRTPKTVESPLVQPDD